MPSKMHISAVFDVSDDQRDQGRIIGKLDEPTAAYEAAIKEATGVEVKIEMRAVRHKGTKPGLVGDPAGTQTVMQGQATSLAPPAARAVPPGRSAAE